ncbi:MAG: hypothetical protein ACI8X5_004118 [Planctomycetota bacterium]|jgi:hypothetical protein
MNSKSLSKLCLGALTLFGAAVLGEAQIERLTLTQMVSRTDNALIGQIVASEVIRIDHPVDGPELYFTQLTVEGNSLENGKFETTVITFAGGFIDDENGVWNSEAPSAEDTKVGNDVVVFYKHTNNMGGDLEANSLFAAHGGLYRTVDGPSGKVVLGRGEGYAVSTNIKVQNLDSRITAIAKLKNK